MQHGQKHVHFISELKISQKLIVTVSLYIENQNILNLKKIYINMIFCNKNILIIKIKSVILIDNEPSLINW